MGNRRKMENVLDKILACLGALIITGCATMPDAEIGYYLPKSTVKITVTQTANCTDVNNPLVLTDAAFAPAYSADHSKRKTLNIDDLDTTFTSGDAAFTFTKDGRLMTFNSTATGVGKDVINVIATFGTTIKRYNIIII